MAKSKGKSVRSKVVEEDFGMDEVDAFHAEQEKVLFEQGAPARKSKNYRPQDDESDVEVMDINDDSTSEGDYNSASENEEEDDDAEFFGKKNPEDELEEEEEGAWGDRKSNYYGADDLDNEETAKQIEEEALRQQKRHLQELNMDDYIDEDVEEEWSRNAKKHDYGDTLEKTQEESHSISDISKMDAKSRKKYISASHPEFIPLSKELTKLKPILDDLAERQSRNEVANVKFTALSAYLGAVTSYFSVFMAFMKEDEPFTMKEHPVMESILSSKELWRQASTLEEVDDSEDEDEEDIDLEKKMDVEVASSEIDEDEFDSASESMVADSDNDAQEEEEESSSDLDIDISKPRVFKKSKQTNTDDLVEGEIDEVDAEEKKKRKKTLRFYTSKIDQQDKKRDERYTGDLDIPYKERLFERQQRLIEEARKRGLHDKNGADLDENEAFDEQDTKDAQYVNDKSAQDYYETVKASTIERKNNRKQAHQEAVKAAKEGKLAELKEEVGEDGKRAVNYQILKNKGLTPHRKKENRNSRVKKRIKYDKAQKKLKSIRAVYSTPTGAYDGEKTGIKKNLSKSVKF